MVDVRDCSASISGGSWNDPCCWRCKYRVSSSNKKITLTVQKVDTHDGWHQLRKKLPKFHK